MNTQIDKIIDGLPNLHHPDFTKCLYKAFEDFAASQFAASTNSGQGWISVEDGLPDYGVNVLVYGVPKQPTMSNRTLIINNRIDVKGTSIEKTADRYIDKFGFRNMGETFYWQPLPPPPQQQQD